MLDVTVCPYFSSNSSELARRPISVSSSSTVTSMDEESRRNVVDLTADSDNEASVVVVDLTTPVHRHSRPRCGQQSDPNAAILISGMDDEDNDVIIVPSTVNPSPPSATPSLPGVTASLSGATPSLPSATPSTSPRSTTSLSPGSSDIACPICMDSKRTFTAAGRVLVTTTCGHIFCDGCIRKSIQLMHRCPTCSKKLTLKQYHKIFI